MLILHDYFRSSACYRVRIAMQLKELNYQLIPIHLVNNGGEQFSADYLKINPHSLVPTLTHDNKTITQSLAIIEYLDETFPTSPLLPKDPYLKSLVRAFSLSIAADLHPLNNLRVLSYLTNQLKITEEQKNIWYQHWMTKGLTGLEKQLAALNTTTPFCFGDKPTMADICLVPQMYNARRFACDLTNYPALVRIDQNCRQLPAFQAASPEQVKEEIL